MAREEMIPVISTGVVFFLLSSIGFMDAGIMDNRPAIVVQGRSLDAYAYLLPPNKYIISFENNDAMDMDSAQYAAKNIISSLYRLRLSFRFVSSGINPIRKLEPIIVGMSPTLWAIAYIPS